MKFRRITAINHVSAPALVMVLAGWLKHRWLAGPDATNDTTGNADAAVFDSLKL
jgi:hypothetical protein